MKAVALAFPALAGILVLTFSIAQLGGQSSPGRLVQSAPPGNSNSFPELAPLLEEPGPGHNTTNITPPSARQKLPQTFRVIPQRGSPDGLAPGVYESYPYTCIVVVPGGHPDDKMIMGRRIPGSTNEVEPNMPMVKPYLRLIPRGTK